MHRQDSDRTPRADNFNNRSQSHPVQAYYNMQDDPRLVQRPMGYPANDSANTTRPPDHAYEYYTSPTVPPNSPVESPHTEENPTPHHAQREEVLTRRAPRRVPPRLINIRSNFVPGQTIIYAEEGLSPFPQVQNTPLRFPEDLLENVHDSTEILMILSTPGIKFRPSELARRNDLDLLFSEAVNYGHHNIVRLLTHALLHSIKLPCGVGPPKKESIALRVCVVALAYGFDKEAELAASFALHYNLIRAYIADLETVKGVIEAYRHVQAYFRAVFEGLPELFKLNELQGPVNLNEAEGHEVCNLCGGIYMGSSLWWRDYVERALKVLKDVPHSQEPFSSPFLDYSINSEREKVCMVCYKDINFSFFHAAFSVRSDILKFTPKIRPIGTVTPGM